MDFAKADGKILGCAMVQNTRVGNGQKIRFGVYGCVHQCCGHRIKCISEREFSDNYALSSTTIRRALNELVQEHFLERKAGKGSYVRRKKAKRDLGNVIGFTKNMEEMGLIVFLIKGVTYVRNNLPIKCEESFYRTDKYELVFEAAIQ